jgi:WD40 repeat protein
VAVAQRRVAVRQSQIALSRLLAVESNRMLDQQLDVALLLAAASDESAPTIEARAALRAAFERSPRLLRFLGAGPGRVLAAAATRGTGTLLALGEDGTLAAWSRNSGKILSSAKLIEKRITAAAFDSTGTVLALGTADGEIVVGDPATRRPVAFPTGHSGAVTILGFSRDGRTLASAGADGIVAVWDPATGRRKDRGGIRGAEITSIALSPDGTRVAANVFGSGRARVLIAAVGGDAAPAELPGVNGRSDIVFGPDGTTVIFGDQEERVAVWDVIAKRRLRLLRGPDSWITSLAIHPDGTKIVTGRGDGALLLWDLTKSEEPEELEEHLQGVREVAFSPDGTRLASRAGQQVILHDVQDRRRFVTLNGHLGEVETMGFESGGDVLVTGDRNGQVLVWGLNAGRQAEVVVLGDGSMSTGEVHSVAFHPDGTLAAGWGPGAITLWDVGRGRPVRVLDSRQSSVISLSFKPDGRALAAASLDDTVKLLDLATGEVLADWAGHTGKIVNVAFRPDGKVMAAQRDPDTIGFWDVERRMESPSFRPGGPPGEILSLAFSGNGGLLAAGLGDGRVVLTTPTGDREIRVVQAQHGGVVSLAVSPDGRTLAAGNRDGSLVVWDVASGSERVVMRRHERGVTGVAFTPDGSQLASSSIDGTVVIWDPATGLPGVVLDADDSLVMGLAVSPDGAWLAAGSLDGKVRIWDARVDSWRLRACDIANRQLTPREWATHVGDQVPYRAVCPS